jgi:uncharacterized membrane protein (UPF0127 family)
MRASLLRNTLLALVASLGVLGLAPVAESQAGSPGPATATTPVMAIVAECANPQLPPAILDGAGPAPGSLPLTVITATAPSVALHLAVAADENARELGLMCVTRLAPQHGMIFVFDRSSDQEFWMKNTLIPLDMLWVAPDGTVTSVAADVPASTRSTPDDKVARRLGHGRFVIELPSGEAARDGITKGTRLDLPHFP